MRTLKNLLLLLAVLAVARTGYKVIQVAADPPLNTEVAVPRSQPEPASQQQVLRDARALVGEPPAVAASPTVAPAAAPVAVVPDPAQSMQLKGTLLSAAMSLAFVEADGKLLTLQPGERVGDFCLQQIHESAVDFQIAGTTRTLAMGSPPPPPHVAPTPSAVAVVEAPPTRVSVPHGLRDKFFDDTATVSQDVRIQAARKEGKPYGLQVVAVRADGFFTRLGLQKDDFILSVNGKSLSTADDWMTAFYALKNESSARITLDRGGKVYNVGVEFP